MHSLDIRRQGAWLVHDRLIMTLAPFSCKQSMSKNGDIKRDGTTDDKDDDI